MNSDSRSSAPETDTSSFQQIYWEDFSVGAAAEFGATDVVASDIIAYAQEFDPVPCHLDEAVAVNLPAGGLIASDWHSCAMLMRMMCDDYLCRAAGAGAPGVEHVKWFGFVRPGDRLWARRTPLEIRASKSRPRIGIVRMLIEVFNQRDEKVMSWLPVQLFDRRNPDTTPKEPRNAGEQVQLASAMREPDDIAVGSDAELGVFEDVEIGQETLLGSHTFSKVGMLDFATRFNPQYFHADEKAAAASLYGGLIASGWHTAAIWNRLFVLQNEYPGEASAGRRAAHGLSIAVLDMKWPNPVRAGDTINYSTRVTDKIDHKRFAQFGIVKSRNEGINQHGETVLSLSHERWVERRFSLG